MDFEKIAPIAALIGLIGIPELLILVGVAGIFAGVVVYWFLSFLAAWMWPLLFIGVGVVGMIYSVKYADESHNGLYVLLGIVVLIVPLLVTFLYESGALNGPANSYSLLLSLSPGQQVYAGIGTALPIMEALFYASGIGMFIVAVRDGL